MLYLISANVAGDPHVLRETVELSAENAVGVGIHPGLPDMMGFGRRTMDATPEEVRDYVVFQLGALTSFAEQAGLDIQHIKPHGAMYSMLSESADHARAVMEGLLEVDADLIYPATDTNFYELAQECDVLSRLPGGQSSSRVFRVVSRPLASSGWSVVLDAVLKGYVDLDYRPDRTLLVEKSVSAKDPEEVADRVVSIATRGEAEAVDGTMIDVPADNICIHGDNPNSVEVLERIHERPAEADIDLARLDEQV